MPSVDWKAVGFRCGLEIHQQLATDKLFCRCATEDRELDDEAPDFSFRRGLRPTQSELGEVDAAARVEAQRARRFEYLGFHGLSCLVEADEEPPHPVDEDALDVALTMSLLLDAQPVDEVQWMRKIVIDGSNTGGFQRTGLVSLGGRVLGDVGIQTIALEEDSARRVGETDGWVRYGLDRLGIPLVEIATDPDIRDGEHAREVAARIGALLRATGRVKRGIGTIRQDLNVSITGGTRVEIKGVQELNAIPRVIEGEVLRQQHLLHVRDEMVARKWSHQESMPEPVDVSEEVSGTDAKFVAAALKRKEIALGMRLRNLKGLIGVASKEAPRLGRELADHVRQDAGLKGLLHGDELPGLGISENEVTAIRSSLSCEEPDSFLLVVAPAATAKKALGVAWARVLAALDGVPGEVRQAKPDDTTSYLRPMPGAARMYPETDVPPAVVDSARLARLRKALPEPPEIRTKRLIETHGLSQDLAVQIVGDGLDARVVSLAETCGDATLAARTLLAYAPAAQAQGKAWRDGWVDAVLSAVADGKIPKDAVEGVLGSLASGKAKGPEAAIESASAGKVDEAELAEAARRLVADRMDFVKERGAAAVGPLMGVLMKELRGKVDGAKVSQALKQAVEASVKDT